jgi:hypothetical protein
VFRMRISIVHRRATRGFASRCRRNHGYFRGLWSSICDWCIAFISARWFEILLASLCPVFVEIMAMVEQPSCIDLERKQTRKRVLREVPLLRRSRLIRHLLHDNSHVILCHLGMKPLSVRCRSMREVSTLQYCWFSLNRCLSHHVV